MNNEVEKNIKSMLPKELEQVKNLVDKLLEFKINNRTTNLEYLKRNKSICCPNNQNHHIKKNGIKDGNQRYYCYDCKKSFSLTNKSIVEHIKLTYKQLKTLLRCMYDYKSLIETSLEVELSKTSTFELQIRIFDALECFDSDKLLQGVVQVDEKYERISFKGFSKEKMPRSSRHNGKDKHVSGISNDQICIVVAIDENDYIVIKVVGNENASTSMISKALKNKIMKKSILVTDSKNSYIDFAKENDLKLIQIPKGCHKSNDYTINDVNEIMTEISSYLFHKKGVSSRHMQHHMNFIRYRKIIKYTVEYLEANEKMLLDTILLIPRLKSDDVYSTELPFDIDEYKEWYSKYDNL